jgi:hypothetical protein
MKKIRIDPDLLNSLSANPDHAEKTVLVHITKTSRLGGDLFEAQSEMKPVLMAWSKAVEHNLVQPPAPREQANERTDLRAGKPPSISGGEELGFDNKGREDTAASLAPGIAQPDPSLPKREHSTVQPDALATSPDVSALESSEPQADSRDAVPQLSSTFYWKNQPSSRLLSPASLPASVVSVLEQPVSHARSRITGDATITGWKQLSMAIAKKNFSTNAAAGVLLRSEDLLYTTPEQLLLPDFEGRISSLCSSFVKVRVTDLNGHNITYGSGHGQLAHIKPHHRHVTVRAITALAVAMRLRNELPAVAYIFSIAPELIAKDVRDGRLAQAFGTSGISYLLWAIFYRIGQLNSDVSEVRLPNAAADLLVAHFLRNDNNKFIQSNDNEDLSRLLAVLKIPDWLAVHSNPDFWAIRHGVTYGAMLLYAKQLDRKNALHLQMFTAVVRTLEAVVSPVVGSVAAAGIVHGGAEMIDALQGVNTAKKWTPGALASQVQTSIRRVIFTRADAGHIVGCTQPYDPVNDQRLIERFKSIVTSIMDDIAARSIK